MFYPGTRFFARGSFFTKNELLKITLPNEVVYLSVEDIGTIPPEEIKQNIINQLYSSIINQIKKDLEIEVNNQQLLQL